MTRAVVSAPNFRGPIVDGKGVPIPEFRIFLDEIFRRGGSSGDRFADIELNSSVVFPIPVATTVDAEPWVAMPPPVTQEPAPVVAYLPQQAQEPPVILGAIEQRGTWTPTIACLSTPGSNTYASGGQVGHWHRIGSKVTVWGYVALSGAGGAFDAASSGQVTIAGLPFPAAEDAYFKIVLYTSLSVTGAGEGRHPFGLLAAGNSHLGLEQQGENDGAPNITHSHMADGSAFAFQGDYLA